MLINTPITHKIKIAFIPMAIPSRIPCSMVCQGAPRDLPTTAAITEPSSRGMCASPLNLRRVIPMSPMSPTTGIRACIKLGGVGFLLSGNVICVCPGPPTFTDRARHKPCWPYHQPSISLHSMTVWFIFRIHVEMKALVLSLLTIS